MATATYEPHAAPGHHPDAPPPIAGIRFMDAFRLLFGAPNTGHNLFYGALFVLIPVVGQIALLGWLNEIVQRLARRHPNPVPSLEFSDFGHYLGRGVMPFVAQLIVAVPLSIVVSFATFPMMALVVAGNTHRGHELSGPQVAGLLGIALVVLLLSIVSGVATMAVNTRASLTENLSFTFDWATLRAFVAGSWSRFLLASLGYTLLAIPIALGGVLCLYFGIFPAIVILYAAIAHLQWQVYEDCRARGMHPFPLRPYGLLPSEQQFGAGWQR